MYESLRMRTPLAYHKTHVEVAVSVDDVDLILSQVSTLFVLRFDIARNSFSCSDLSNNLNSNSAYPNTE